MVRHMRAQPSTAHAQKAACLRMRDDMNADVEHETQDALAIQGIELVGR
jgi:hypothetical protein